MFNRLYGICLIKVLNIIKYHNQSIILPYNVEDSQTKED